MRVDCVSVPTEIPGTTGLPFGRGVTLEDVLAALAGGAAPVPDEVYAAKMTFAGMTAAMGLDSKWPVPFDTVAFDHGTLAQLGAGPHWIAPFDCVVAVSAQVFFDSQIWEYFGGLGTWAGLIPAAVGVDVNGAVEWIGRQHVVKAGSSAPIWPAGDERLAPSGTTLVSCSAGDALTVIGGGIEGASFHEAIASFWIVGKR